MRTRERPTIMSLRSALTITVLIVAATAGCARSDGAGETVDCVSPLVFEGRKYLLAATARNVKPGAEVGKGMLEACADGADDQALRERVVFALPDVPRQEAVVLTDAQGGNGIIYISDEMPSDGWDPDLDLRLDSSQ